MSKSTQLDRKRAPSFDGALKPQKKSCGGAYVFKPEFALRTLLFLSAKRVALGGGLVNHVPDAGYTPANPTNPNGTGLDTKRNLTKV